MVTFVTEAEWESLNDISVVRAKSLSATCHELIREALAQHNPGRGNREKP